MSTEKTLVARHLTWAGEYLRDLELTVDVTDRVSCYAAKCRGCTGERNSNRLEVFEWAMSHAAGCRALPRPGVA